MPVEIQAITPTKVSLTIEVEADKVNEEKEKVFNEMARHVQVRGFRKGKAPRKIVEKYVSTDALVKEVLGRLIPTACDQAMKSNQLIPVTRPEYEVVSFADGQPLKFKATFEKRPEIPLKQYKGMEVVVDERPLREEDVEKTVLSLLESRAMYEDWPDAAVTEGHGAVLDLQGLVDGAAFEGGSFQGLLLEIKKEWIIPGFMEQIVGMKAGEEREIRVVLPKNFEPKIAGKEALFKVRVEAVKQKKLPELNDGFAQSLGEYKTVDDLKESIRKNISSFLENQEKTEGFHKAMDKLTESLDFPAPEVFVEDRMKQFERDLLHNLEDNQKPFPDFLREKYPEVYTIEGVSEDDKAKRAVERLRGELYPKAVKMAKVDLILDEIWRRENLRITQEEIGHEVNRMSSHYNMTPEALAKALQDEHTFQVFAAGMLRAKASLVVRDSLIISHEENKA